MKLSVHDNQASKKRDNRRQRTKEDICPQPSPTLIDVYQARQNIQQHPLTTSQSEALQQKVYLLLSRPLHLSTKKAAKQAAFSHIRIG